MAYSTGAGTFTQLLAAIVAHAVADGWTESGGVGTGFPIGINNTFVDITTYTQQDTDFTLGSTRGTFTATYASIGIGGTALEAAANATGQNCRVPNAFFDITNWHIYSDSSSGTNYIHVVFEFNNGVDAQVFQHFSFGEIEKGALTYTGISYAASGYRRGYAASPDGGNSAGDWNSIVRGSWQFGGAVGRADSGSTETCYYIHGTSPVNVAGGYPATGTLLTQGDLLWDSTRMGSSDLNNGLNGINETFGDSFTPGWSGMEIVTNMPFTGAISMQILPFILANGAGPANLITWCGTFPDVRQCTMVNYNPGDEVTFAGDTWQVFPWTKKTVNEAFGTERIVTSGQAAFAYKKVL